MGCRWGRQVAGLAFVAVLGCSAAAQETPPANRVAWLEILPEPLPDGAASLGLEFTTQFVSETGKDLRSPSGLDGEEWQVTADFPWRIGWGFLNLRVRVNHRSGGIADQAILDWHKILGMPAAGRDQVAPNRFSYLMQVDGVTIARLDHPVTQLMPLDLAWCLPFGDALGGGRAGLSVQLPNGDPGSFGGTGGTAWTLGAAGWRTHGSWTLHGQAEQVFIQLPAGSLYRKAMDRGQIRRGWIGLGCRLPGPGVLAGLGVDFTISGQESPYHIGVVEVDHAGWQQHWTLTHTRFPRLRFTVSEEAGVGPAPDVTAALVFRY